MTNLSLGLPGKKGGSMALPLDGKKAGGMAGLDLTKLNKDDDYQDEFMAKYDEFSESWRNLIEKHKRFWIYIFLERYL